MKRLFIVVLVSFGVMGTIGKANAEHIDKIVTFTTGPDCKYYSVDYANSKYADNKVFEVNNPIMNGIGYIDGFLTAFHWIKHTDKQNPLGSPWGGNVYQMVAAYCILHPKSTVLAGVLDTLKKHGYLQTQ